MLLFHHIIYFLICFPNRCKLHRDCQCTTKVHELIDGTIHVFNNGIAHTAEIVNPPRGINIMFHGKLNELVAQDKKPKEISVTLRKWYENSVDNKRKSEPLYLSLSEDEWTKKRKEFLALLPSDDTVKRYKLNHSVSKNSQNSSVSDKCLKTLSFLQWCKDHELSPIRANKSRFDGLKDDDQIIVLKGFEYSSEVQGTPESCYGCIFTTKKLLESLYNFYVVYKDTGLHLASDGISIITVFFTDIPHVSLSHGHTHTCSTRHRNL